MPQGTVRHQKWRPSQVHIGGKFYCYISRGRTDGQTCMLLPSEYRPTQNDAPISTFYSAPLEEGRLEGTKGGRREEQRVCQVFVRQNPIISFLLPTSRATGRKRGNVRQSPWRKSSQASRSLTQARNRHCLRYGKVKACFVWSPKCVEAAS